MSLWTETPEPTRVSKWLQMVKSGYKWLQMVTNGYKWLQMATNGYKWLQMVTNGYTWLQVVTNGYKWLQMVTSQSQYSTVQYSTVQYSTVQYSTVQYSAVQCGTVQSSLLLDSPNTQWLYSTTGYKTVFYLVKLWWTNGRKLCLINIDSGLMGQSIFKCNNRSRRRKKQNKVVHF